MEMLTSGQFTMKPLGPECRSLEPGQQTAVARSWASSTLLSCTLLPAAMA